MAYDTGRKAPSARQTSEYTQEARVKLFYSLDYVRAEYAFDTTRKARWVAESLQSEPVAGVEFVAPEPVTETMLCAIHDPAYVAAVRTGEPRTLAETQDFRWDALLWPSVCASTGGTLAAADMALREGRAGSLSSGLHHARREQGKGYCTFNGLALAAHHALAGGAKSVLILDLDAHCGGGTHSLVAQEPRIRHADIAVDAYDSYTASGDNRFELVGDSAHYLPAIQSLLTDLARSGAYDLCLYNAGMDPHEGSAEGGLAGVTEAMLAERERMVFAWCRARAIPVAFVLAGGYVSPQLSQQKLVALHRLTVAAAANLSPASAQRGEGH
jgi:acetoin utilization deacetylase AcuC-like enzyme